MRHLRRQPLAVEVPDSLRGRRELGVDAPGRVRGGPRRPLARHPGARAPAAVALHAARRPAPVCAALAAAGLAARAGQRVGLRVRGGRQAAVAVRRVGRPGAQAAAVRVPGAAAEGRVRAGACAGALPGLSARRGSQRALMLALTRSVMGEEPQPCQGSFKAQALLATDAS